MEREKFNAVMGVLVPQIIGLITKDFGGSEISAINMFYASRVYSILEREETKLWHLSPLTLYNMYVEERNTGSFVIPEEA